EWEARQPERYELVDGVARMMVGGTNAHSKLKGNLFLALDRAAGDVFVEGPKVVTAEALTYPDVVVTCGPVDLRDDRIAEPLVLVEVLSRSTSDYDRGGKWLAYQTIPSLRHYLMVAQDSRRVDVHSRAGEDWILHTVLGDGDVELSAIDRRLSMADIYEGLPC
ncbi:MAG: Uma2 family endonuclease, partial [Alphaproteobacteria bacterium]|nr:Uma2 family endonuclease [Alphaproteobacteria bacterium]